MDFIKDPYQLGVRDDGTDSGIVRTELITGNLIKLPFSPLTYSIQNQGSGNTASSQNGGIFYNSDGTCTGLNIATFNSTDNYVAVWYPFYGSVFGVRFRAGGGGFTVTVDGALATLVEDPETYLGKESQGSSQNHEVSVITHRDLAPGIHFAKIIFPAGVSSLLHGVLVAEAGTPNKPYLPVHTGVNASASTAVPTSSANIAPYPASSGVPFVAISKLYYYNSTGSAITLTLSTPGTITFLNQVIAAGDTFELSYPVPVTSGFARHQASATGLVLVAIGAV
jgi:hypothetical protein